jgi:N-methylhydantoinase B
LVKLPPGTYEAEGWLDDDGITAQPVRLKARVTLGPDKVTFDFAGTDAQRPAPMNSNLTQTFTACVYVLKCLVDPDIPVNEGFYQPIEVLAPEGSVVNAVHPGAIVGGWEVCMRLCEVLFKALSNALPDRVPAGTKGMVCHVGFGGENPRNGDYYTFLETLGGGYGGRRNSDGPDAVQTHFQNTQNAPIEETELNYPVCITKYGLIPDSEGAGRRRGGLGVCREYSFPDHGPVFTMLADRVRFAPWGLFGGGEGRLARYLLVSDGKVGPIPSKSSTQLKKGNVVRVETCGGGGYGPPWERPADSVLRDVRERKLSVARAREAYGVEIDTATWSVDAEATSKLRAALRNKGQHQ